ncbi:hypothetical protein D9758_010721 [Tetrapyrgos nigripes]|uniref:Uncharacterized protein n=1 Tax=Tetrapyrgos nigripes TaxID=182062 RepID=A0A8H5D6C7_9AGAR|nr:hypothetical protein D9758_010721 [Tetrapyrgos nigripes]
MTSVPGPQASTRTSTDTNTIWKASHSPVAFNEAQNLRSQTDASLCTLAKRYRDPDHHSPNRGSQLSITLIFAHALGYPYLSDKEHWEPTLSELFNIAHSQKDTCLVIKEAWCIDSQDHDSSAVLAMTIAGAIYSLMSSAHIDVDSYLVLVGHSAGAASWVTSQ